MKKENRSLLIAALIGILTAFSLSLKSQSTINSFTYTAKFLQSDFQQLYQATRLAAPTMTLPNSMTTYTYSRNFNSSDNQQVYEAIRGLGSAISSYTGSAWQTNGNAIGTNTNFIGTTTKTSLLFRTNNTQVMKLDSNGFLKLATGPLSVIHLGEISNLSAIWLNQSTRTNNNYAIQSDGLSNYINSSSGGANYFYVNNAINAGKIGTTNYLSGQTTIGNTANFGGQPTLNVIGTMSVSSTSTLNAIRSIVGTATMQTGEISSGSYGIWMNQLTPLTTNYCISGDVGSNVNALNGLLACDLRAAGNNVLRCQPNTSSFTGSLGINQSVQNANLHVNGTMSVSSTATLNAAKINNTLTVGNTSTLTGGNSGTLAVINDLNFSLQFSSLAASPADGITYYIGQNGFPVSQNSQNGIVYIPFNCTLVGYTFNNYTGGTTGSGETFSVYARVNDATDITLTTTASVGGTAPQTFTSNTLNTNINANSYINIKVIAPTWATNPTAMYTGVTLFFRRRL